MTGRDRERTAGAQLTAHPLLRMSRDRRSDDGPGVDLGPRTGASRADALASVTRRLYDDFREQATLVDVVLTVGQCRRQLDIVVDASLPEMVERLARQRLAARFAVGRRESSA